jgi:hypothetical protein
MTPEDFQQVTAIVTTAKDQIFEAMRDMQTSLLAEIRAEIRAAEQRTNARVEQVETALLTEFHKWASPLEARIRTHAAAIRAIDAEQEFQADRLKKLEEKAPGQPPQ